MTRRSGAPYAMPAAPKPSAGLGVGREKRRAADRLDRPTGLTASAAACTKEWWSFMAEVDTGGIAAAQLRAIVERIERLEEEKKTISDDIKDVYAEAKANGYDTKTLRTVVRLRKQDVNERQEAESLLDLYMHALGMVAGSAAADDA
jgi:uncharacterized protein (UPF0335 family)